MDAGEDPRTIQVSLGGIRGDARPRASSDERAAKGYAFRGAEGAEATSVSRPAEEKTGYFRWATTVLVHEAKREFAAVLAAQVLRLQCLQREEETGETGVHAWQSCKTRAGEKSGRVDLEQLSVL